jgi:DNA polymerase-3 subunit epsilon
MTWLTGRLCAFDTESTGVDTSTDRIVSACVAFVGGGEPAEFHEFLIDPGIEIPDSATKIHGITTEHAREHGSNAAESVREIGDTLTEASDQGIPIVGWNIAYDLSLLDSELARHLWDSILRRPVIDGLVLDKAFDRWRKKTVCDRKLINVAKHYDVILSESEAHGAKADAMAAVRVLWKMARKFPAIAEYSLDELHDLQVEWAEEQQASLHDYFRKQGKESTVERGWPIYEGKRS